MTPFKKRNKWVFKKGHIPHNQGRKRSKETREKVSLSRILRKKRLGYLISSEARAKMSLSRKGKKQSPKHIKNRVASRKKNKTWHSDKTKERISRTNKERKNFVLENNPNWRGGLSYKLYPLSWTRQLKEEVRARDYYICQICFKTQKELKRKLAIHHIDYNKNNLDKDNLISLCQSCHLKTNFNRTYWESYFNEQMKERGLLVELLNIGGKNC